MNFAILFFSRPSPSWFVYPKVFTLFWRLSAGFMSWYTGNTRETGSACTWQSGSPFSLCSGKESWFPRVKCVRLTFVPMSAWGGQRFLPQAVRFGGPVTSPRGKRPGFAGFALRLVFPSSGSPLQPICCCKVISWTPSTWR